MSIIFDALKKAQMRLISGHSKNPPAENQEAKDKPGPKVNKSQGEPLHSSTGFAPDEDLTQPIRPLAGAKTKYEGKDKEKGSEDKNKLPPKKERQGWIIHDILHMNPFAFLGLIFLGLLGSALVFYIFSYKLKDKYLIQVPAEDASLADESIIDSQSKPGMGEKDKLKKNIFFLSPEVSLTLNGIVSSEGSNLALIDDEILEEGDTIKGATILTIGVDEVILSFHGKEIILPIKK